MFCEYEDKTGTEAQVLTQKNWKTAILPVISKTWTTATSSLTIDKIAAADLATLHTWKLNGRTHWNICCRVQGKCWYPVCHHSLKITSMHIIIYIQYWPISVNSYNSIENKPKHIQLKKLKSYLILQSFFYFFWRMQNTLSCYCQYFSFYFNCLCFCNFWRCPFAIYSSSVNYQHGQIWRQDPSELQQMVAKSCLKKHVITYMQVTFLL